MAGQLLLRAAFGVCPPFHGVLRRPQEHPRKVDHSVMAECTPAPPHPARRNLVGPGFEPGTPCSQSRETGRLVWTNPSEVREARVEEVPNPRFLTFCISATQPHLLTARIRS